MFFILSKVLSFLLSPFFWIMGALLYAIITKKQVRRKRILIFSFIVIYILGNGFLLEEAVRKWETPIIPADKITKAYDYGIVLGGMASYDTLSRRLNFHQSADRLWQALYLYKTGKVKKLMISGGAGSLLHKDETEADRIYAFLVKLGIPSRDIMMEAKSRNTHENAVETAKIIHSSNPQGNCLLITSALHMKRAMGCFKKERLKVSPYSTDFSAGPRKWDPDKLLLPSPGNIDGWGFYLREIVGYYTYRLRGYL